MGRVSSYKRPKAANDPERYEKLLFGDRYNNAPTARKQKMTVAEKRHRMLMARMKGQPNPFAKPDNKPHKRKSASNRADDGDDSDSDEDSTPAGPPTEQDATTGNKVATTVIRSAQQSDGPDVQTNSDRALNAKIKLDVKRQEGETMKEYRRRLKRERNRVIKVIGALVL